MFYVNFTGIKNVFVNKTLLMCGVEVGEFNSDHETLNCELDTLLLLSDNNNCSS